MTKPPTMDPDIETKKLEYEERKARAKALQLRLTCTICGAKPRTLLNCPCGTTQYCSTDCQRIDWRDRGHRKACKKIRNERAAEAARAEAPPPPPEEVVYGPAPRSHADEVRARIAAEHEAARARREANPEREPTSERFGGRCPICFDEWDVNANPMFQTCCCRMICISCAAKTEHEPCPLCRAPRTESDHEMLVHIRRHVENEVPEALYVLGTAYYHGRYGLVQSKNKAAKLWKRAVQLGSVHAMCSLGRSYDLGDGVKQDRKKSMQLYRLSADRGNARAQYNIAYDLRVDGSFVEAFSYFKRSADQGFTHAIYACAQCYLHGQGVAFDLEAATRLCERAAAEGSEHAIAMLAQIRAKTAEMNRVLQQMGIEVPPRSQSTR